MLRSSPLEEKVAENGTISLGSTRSLVRKLRRASPVLGGLIVALGCLGLLAWNWGITSFVRVATGPCYMRPNTAIGLVLGGAALCLVAARRERLRRAALIPAGALLALGALTLLEHVSGESLGIDLLLFEETLLREGGALPGRISPHTALVFTLLGAAFLVIDIETRRGHRPADVLALLAMLGSWLALLGSVYGATPPHAVSGLRVGMAVHTATGCLLLGLGLLFARPEAGLMRLVAGESAGGSLARRLLPVSLLVPFVLGLLLLSVASWVGLSDLQLGAALLVTFTVAAFGALVFVTAKTLNRTDSQRRAAESEAAFERLKGEDVRAAAAAEREQLIAELRRALAIRDEFLTIAAHELRTPLSALALQLESLRRGLLKETGCDREKVLRNIQTAMRQTERLNVLVQSLLDVSRIGAGRLMLDVEEADMGGIVHDVAARMSDEAERHGSALHVNAGRGVLGAWDRPRIEQVLTNLLANAVKYGAGQPVDVELSPGCDDLVEVRVVDRGIGIGEDDVQRIFGMFERACPSQHYGGLGLGLYIAREIVEAHGGTIEVQSHPGDGAAFTVRLPRRTPVPPAD